MLITRCAECAAIVGTRSSSSRAWATRQSRDPYVINRDVLGLRARSAFKLQEMDARHGFLWRGATVVDLGAAPGGWTQVAVAAVYGDGVQKWSPPLVDLVSPPAPPPLAAHAPLRRRVSFMDIHALEALGGAALLPTPAPPPPPPRLPPPLVIAVDLCAMEPLAGAQLVRGDFLHPATRAALRGLLPMSNRRRRRLLQEAATTALEGGGVDARVGGDGAVDVVLSDLAPSFTGNARTDSVRQMALAWSALVFTTGDDALTRGGAFVVKARYGEGYAPFRAALERRFRSVIECKPPSSRQESGEAFLLAQGWGEGGGGGAHVTWTPGEAEILRGFGLVV